MEITPEQSEAMYDLALILSENEKKEAEAVKGYTEQLRVIDRVRAVTSDPELLEFLDKLEAATKEKQSDELNHAHSLLEEYQNVTGISPAAD